MKLKWIKTDRGWDSEYCGMVYQLPLSDKLCKDGYGFYSILKLNKDTHLLSIFRRDLKEELTFCHSVKSGKRLAQEHYDAMMAKDSK